MFDTRSGDEETDLPQILRSQCPSTIQIIFLKKNRKKNQNVARAGADGVSRMPQAAAVYQGCALWYLSDATERVDVGSSLAVLVRVVESNVDRDEALVLVLR